MEKALQFFAKDKLLVNLIVISVIIYGVISLGKVKSEAFPPTEIDKMKIIITYPGASALDSELNTIIPIEQELQKINGISKYTSIAIENGGQMEVEIDQDVKNKQQVKDEIFRKVSPAQIKDIPDEVESIIVRDINPKLRPIYVIAISPKDPQTPERELYQISDSLEKLLGRVDGVSDVDNKGYLNREIKINVLTDKAASEYISLNEVINSIRVRNIRSTGGTLQSLHKEQNLLTIGQFDDPLDVKDVIIRSGFEQRRLRIKDIAEVEDGFEKESVRIRVNKSKAVVLTVKKKEQADTLNTITNIEKFLSENKSRYDQKFKITTVADDSKSVRSLLEVVTSNAIMGFILVIIILLFFLDFKTSFWTAFSIPFCILVVISFMNLGDFSLNILTMGAIITVLGMMVDDAIVIAEVVYEKKAQGLSPLKAAVEGAKEIFWPLNVTILSTIVAFLPMLTITGVMGKFIYVYPIIISVTLIASLLESLFILPNHLAHGKAKKMKETNWFEPVMNFYRKALVSSLKYRYAVIIFFILMFLGTILISRETIKNFVVIWDDSSEKIVVDLETPLGTTLKQTEKLTQKIEDLLYQNISKDELLSLYTQVGVHGGAGSVKQENWSTVQAQLVPKTERERTADEIIRAMRRNINVKQAPEFKKILLIEKKLGPTAGSAVDIKLITDDKAHAKEVASRVQKFLSGIGGVKDIDSDIKKGKPEIKLDFDYSRMAQYGLNVESVAQTVRAAYSGLVATSIQTIDQKLNFRVQVKDSVKKGRDYLLGLKVPNAQGRLIRLREIARIKDQRGSASIQHYNGSRSVSITAEIDSEAITSSQVIKQVKKEFANIHKEYPNLYLIYEGESKETQAALSGLKTAFMIALMLIYFIVVLLFKSFSQPILVLCVIPFGMIGVLLGFSMHGIPLSFMGMIGAIGLSGIVINDSIIMVSFINTVFKEQADKKKKGTPDKKAAKKAIIENIAHGARQRLRPIVITTVTTVAGLLPTVYGIGGNAQSLVPTVMAMAYGLLFATLLTLILVPALYLVNLDVQNFIDTYIKGHTEKLLTSGSQIFKSFSTQPSQSAKTKPKKKRKS